jgi:hypothetical protein
LLVQFGSHCQSEQRTGVAVAHAAHLQLWDALKLLARLARREHHADRLRHQATGNEGQRQRGGLIQPLGVIHETEERTLFSHLREQAQHRQSHEEPIRGSAAAQAEHDLQGPTLWSRQSLESIEERRAQLMQTRVRELHLGLHPHRPHHRQIRRRLKQVFQQRGLPDPGLPPQHQRPTLTPADVLEQSVQQRALAIPPEQGPLPHRCGKTSVHDPPRIVEDKTSFAGSTVNGC